MTRYTFILFLLVPPVSFSFSQKTPIGGFVDMHTHPRNDLSFGTQLFYGVPYGDISVSMGNCNEYHGSWGLGNLKGNVFRQKLAEQTEQQYHSDCKHSAKGYPDFESWPSWCSVLHQQMWIDWIERAHHGGLNIMVALATNNHCIADAAETQGPYDDKQSMLNSIQGIKDMVENSSFMQIAYSAQEARTIVLNGKMAVILGIEMDNIGNFYSPADRPKGTFNENPNHNNIKQELDEIWDLGVRYIFPIHLTDNIFGGAAMYISAFSVANKYNTGKEFTPEPVSTEQSGIAFNLTHPVLDTDPEADCISKIALRLAGGILPESVNPSRRENYTFYKSTEGMGHRNSKGLTTNGRFALTYMMQKGFMIDIDHMSDKMVTEVLSIAEENDYPVNSGHNGLRGTKGSEAHRTMEQYKRIHKLGGMAGLGHGDYASNFVSQYRQVHNIMGAGSVAIGTDVNGFYPLPRPDTNTQIQYDSTFTRSSTGKRVWDINIDGFAHYGLFPDYIKSWKVAGMTQQELDGFMRSAEHFVQMWEKCEIRKSDMAP